MNHFSILACLAAVFVGSQLNAAPGDVQPEEGDHVWLYADTQLHNMLADSARARSASADKKAKVAIRPPVLDLWGRHALIDAAEKMRSDGHLALFLGDAANVSCISEFSAFIELNREVNWIFVPGNHDGYYMGNMTFAPRDKGSEKQDKSWEGSCLGGSGLAADEERKIRDLENALYGFADKGKQTHVDEGVLTKAHAIWLYLDDLRKRGVIASDPLVLGNWSEGNDEGQRMFITTGTVSHGQDEARLDIVASVSGQSNGRHAGNYERSWDSYLLQRLTLPDGRVFVLMDTSDYWRSPTSGFFRWRQWLGGWTGTCDRLLGYLPGTCGDMSEQQLDQAAKWASEAGKQGAPIIFAGHHPWAAIGSRVRKQALQKMPVLGHSTYLSAHVHDPANETEGREGKRPRELNIGSTTDYPMEYARLQLKPDTEPDVTPYRLAPRDVSNAPVCDLPLSYNGAYPENGSIQYYKMVFATYAALLAKVGENPDWVARLDLSDFACADDAGECLVQIRTELEEARASFSGSTLSCELRSLLSSLGRLDRTQLSEIPEIRKIERDCAIWGSVEEFKKNGYFGENDERRILPWNDS